MTPTKEGAELKQILRSLRVPVDSALWELPDYEIADAAKSIQAMIADQQRQLLDRIIEGLPEEITHDEAVDRQLYGFNYCLELVTTLLNKIRREL